MQKFIINQFICRKDNYGVLIHNTDTKETLSIDAPDANIIDKNLTEKDLKLSHLFITHKHLDHIEGITFLKDKYNCLVIGPEGEKDQIPLIDQTVYDEQYINFSGSPVRVIHTPGHTLGHVMYFFEKEKILFAGDTLFLMGCGRVFEGTYDQMYESMEKIKTLPPDTTIYCGHEYSYTNAKFAANIDHKNSLVHDRLKRIEEKTLAGKQCLPTTLEKELKTNPFLRYNNKYLKESIGMDGMDGNIIFAEIRKRKDNF
tara:strand:+ start:8876 stop:9646 length:771 start_codon:yes stop_codon:yes gene_type:complete